MYEDIEVAGATLRYLPPYSYAGQRVAIVLHPLLGERRRGETGAWPEGGSGNIASRGKELAGRSGNLPDEENHESASARPPARAADR